MTLNFQHDKLLYLNLPTTTTTTTTTTRMTTIIIIIVVVVFVVVVVNFQDLMCKHRQTF